ncbi:hypothetical protein [Celeribacter naphthalenivorans]|uniref:hypothetical protein n=1 Tax=Celeribacter naphthalenivorans TaxID=1614694 RepID=UPI001CF9D3BB|nr:hypothetical protein [Celeribacter naphthalenivorans]
MKNFLIAGLLACTCATSASAGKVTGTYPIDKDFALHELNWNPRGTTIIRWEVINDNGYIAVCGGYSSTGGGTTYKASGDFLASAGVKMNGESILKNLRYFAKLKSNQQSIGHVGEVSNCVRTGTPAPKANASFELYSTKTDFRY